MTTIATTTGIRIFRENGEEIYIRYEAGEPISGRRISKLEADRIEAIAYKEKLRKMELKLHQ